MKHRGPRPRGAETEYVAAARSLFPVLVLIRMVEFVLVRSRHVMPAGAFVLTLRGVLADLGVTLIVGAVLVLPVLGLSLLSRSRRAYGASRW